MVADLKVLWRIFLGLAAFIAVIGAIYWFVSYEDAGTTLLALAAGLALMCGGYLFVQDRRKAPATPGDHGSQYLPHESVWPFGIGLGVFLAFNGLILGPAWALPGAVIVATSLGGFVSQSRRRA
jgi:cytochrome c oxidase subunit IV